MSPSRPARSMQVAVGCRRGRRRPAAPGLALFAVAALGLTACGGSVSVSTGKTIDIDEVQSTISKQYAAQGIPISKLDCKDDVQAKKGAPIVCSAVNEKGTILNIQGTVTAVDGKGGGSFRVKTVSAAANGTVIADKALSLLEEKTGQKARSLTCPPTVPIPTKPSVTCELTTLDGSKLDTKLTLNSEAYLNVEVAKTPKSGPAG